MSEQAYIVYELVDPRTGSTFYVGKGYPNRPAQHLMETRKWLKGGANGKASEKVRRIAEIMASGESPMVRIVCDTTDADEAAERERAHIAEIGIDLLTNERPGGDGRPRTGRSRRSLLLSVLPEEREAIDAAATRNGESVAGMLLRLALAEAARTPEEDR